MRPHISIIHELSHVYQEREGKNEISDISDIERNKTVSFDDKSIANAPLLRKKHIVEYAVGRKGCGSFAEYRLFYRALLQKRPAILHCK